MELRILNINGSLINAILKPSKIAEGTQDIEILNQGCPMNNNIPLPESPKEGAW